MNKFLIIASFLVILTVSQSSYAYEKVICESKGIMYSLFKKKAYKVIFDVSDITTVNASLLKIKYNILFQKSSATLADLNCVSHGKNTGTSKDDPATPFVTCHQNNRRDSGYQVALSNPDFAGRHIAIISELTFAGLNKVAKLKCERE